jgi:hypothetical protein
MEVVHMYLQILGVPAYENHPRSYVWTLDTFWNVDFSCIATVVLVISCSKLSVQQQVSCLTRT